MGQQQHYYYYYAVIREDERTPQKGSIQPCYYSLAHIMIGVSLVEDERKRVGQSAAKVGVSGGTELCPGSMVPFS